MDVKLPKLGEGSESGTVVSVLVQEGDQVEKGQTLLELENEKAVAPIPAPISGAVSKIRVKVGDKLSVGQIILSLGGEGGEAKPAEAASSAAPQKGVHVPETQVSPATAEQGEESMESSDDSPKPPPAAAPSIRRVARELGIDLHRIRGSERGGRIVMADLRQYIQRLQALAAGPKSAKAAAPAAPVVAESIDFSKWGPVIKKPLTPLRQTISRRMSENWNTIPHVTQFDDIDITDLMTLRKKHAAAYEAQGAKLTLTPLTLRAVARTLRRHPSFNCSLDEANSEMVFKDYIHIGLAVDTEQGLLVPVIRDVDQKSLLALAKEVNDLAERARERKISLEEMRGGTFTISNQGGIGGAHFTPIVNKPEVAILGLGRGAMKPVVREGRIEPRLLMPVGLSYDHRVIDGGSAARFIVDLAEEFGRLNEDDLKL